MAKLNKYKYKGLFEKSLFMKPTVKSTLPSPLLFHQENATEKY
jgi:hypothetical protein